MEVSTRQRLRIVVGAGLLILVLIALASVFPWNRCGLGRKASFALDMRGIGQGVEAFKTDWGEYPPSRATKEPEAYRAAGGSGLLAYYLLGPTLKGWGGPAGGATPVNTINPRAYGPYLDPSAARPFIVRSGLVDWREAGKPILYFRASPGRDPLFDVADNPLDPTGQTGFVSQRHLEMAAKRRDAGGKPSWARVDYLLISPGEDRLYGPAIFDASTGKPRPARPGEEGEASCDDVTNFEPGP